MFTTIARSGRSPIRRASRRPCGLGRVRRRQDDRVQARQDGVEVADRGDLVGVDVGRGAVGDRADDPDHVGVEGAQEPRRLAADPPRPDDGHHLARPPPRRRAGATRGRAGRPGSAGRPCRTSASRAPRTRPAAGRGRRSRSSSRRRAARSARPGARAGRPRRSSPGSSAGAATPGAGRRGRAGRSRTGSPRSRAARSSARSARASAISGSGCAEGYSAAGIRSCS